MAAAQSPIAAAIGKICADAGWPPEIARLFIAANVPIEIAAKAAKRFRKDAKRGFNRRIGAYSTLVGVLDVRRVNAFFAAQGPSSEAGRVLTAEFGQRRTNEFFARHPAPTTPSVRKFAQPGKTARAAIPLAGRLPVRRSFPAAAKRAQRSGSPSPVAPAIRGRNPQPATRSSAALWDEVIAEQKRALAKQPAFGPVIRSAGPSNPEILRRGNAR